MNPFESIVLGPVDPLHLALIVYLLGAALCGAGVMVVEPVRRLVRWIAGIATGFEGRPR